MFNKREIVEMILKLECQGVELNLSEEGFEWYYKLKEEVVSEEMQQVAG